MWINVDILKYLFITSVKRWILQSIPRRHKWKYMLSNSCGSKWSWNFFKTFHFSTSYTLCSFCHTVFILPQCVILLTFISHSMSFEADECNSMKQACPSSDFLTLVMNKHWLLSQQWFNVDDIIIQDKLRFCHTIFLSQLHLTKLFYLYFHFWKNPQRVKSRCNLYWYGILLHLICYIFIWSTTKGKVDK